MKGMVSWCGEISGMMSWYVQVWGMATCFGEECGISHWYVDRNVSSAGCLVRHAMVPRQHS